MTPDYAPVYISVDDNDTYQALHAQSGVNFFLIQASNANNGYMGHDEDTDRQTDFILNKDFNTNLK